MSKSKRRLTNNPSKQVFRVFRRVCERAGRTAAFNYAKAEAGDVYLWRGNGRGLYFVMERTESGRACADLGYRQLEGGLRASEMLNALRIADMMLHWAECDGAVGAARPESWPSAVYDLEGAK